MLGKFPPINLRKFPKGDCPSDTRPCLRKNKASPYDDKKDIHYFWGKLYLDD